jgi:ubiquinone/menaquinone biosynthesis C-methylase UbiE
VIHKLGSSLHLIQDSKYSYELGFWKNELNIYEKWYDNKIPSHYNEPSPEEDQKIIVHSHSHSAILTWAKIHQYRKYLEDLLLDVHTFDGLKVLDVGSGPIPSASIFENCEIFCLDPLLGDYLKIGYPLHYYDRVKFICGYSENIPVEDCFFDAIISVNAIDHVDDLLKTAKELQRVLKPHGLIRMHIHYHKKTNTEPLELNDDIVKMVFDWCPGWHKICETKKKRGCTLKDNEELFVLWSNFD